MKLKITSSKEQIDHQREFGGVIEIESEIVGEFHGFACEDDYSYHQHIDEVNYSLGSVELTEDTTPELVMVLDGLIYELVDGKKLRDYYLNN